VSKAAAGSALQRMFHYSETNLFGGKSKPQRSGGIPIKIPIKVKTGKRRNHDFTLKVLSLLLSYPEAEMFAA
jgi:hypothetical protein